MKAALVLLLVAGSSSAACAGNAHKASEPAQPAPPAAEATPSTLAAPVPDAAGTPAAPENAPLSLQLADWQGQFSETLADLERLDCANACRALGSLERSADNICGIAGPRSAPCEDVQKRRADAKKRVHDRCGVCP